MADVLKRERFLVIMTLLCLIPNGYFTNNTKLTKSCKIDSIFSIYHKQTQTICENRLVDFDEWDFEETSLLLEAFPLDPETRNYVRQVRRSVFSYVKPIPLKTEPALLAVSSDVVAEVLDINPDSVVGRSQQAFVRFVSGTEVTSRSVPLAHRYGGHQFGEWADQLGDGRAVMLGEYVNRKGERWELQLKGSGKTPYSRRGDGRAVLRSSVREFLASEAMHHLGIPTSQAVSLVVSNDQVWRDQFYDGHPMQEKAAVVLRVAKSWFRIGSLEILTRYGETDLLRKVVDFIIEHHFLDVFNSPEKYLDFFSHVVAMTADMIARWQAVGFTHGVCNTDNFSLLSITIDYGPFGFLDEYNTDFIPNSSDDEGRYSYRNQPSIGYYNLEKLLEALSPLLDTTRARKILQGYATEFNARFMDLFRVKLGLIGTTMEDEMLIKSLLWMMEVTHADFTMTFRELSNLALQDLEQGRLPVGAWSLERLAKHKNWPNWLEIYRNRIQRNGDDDSEEKRQRRMQGVNPRYILRNWMAQSAIDKGDKGDFTEIHKLLCVLQRPYDTQEEAETSGYASPPPPWATKLRVSCSS